MEVISSAFLSGNQMFELIEEAGAKPKSRDRKTSKRRGSN